MLTYNQNNVRERGNKNGQGTQRPAGKQNVSGESKDPKQKGPGLKPDVKISGQQNEGLKSYFIALWLNKTMKSIIFISRRGTIRRGTTK